MYNFYLNKIFKLFILLKEIIMIIKTHIKIILNMYKFFLKFYWRERERENNKRITIFSRENVRENNKKFIENNMRRKKSRNKKYRNKHQIIQVMLCKKITLYYYILSI